ncbi:MAG: 1-acyl-sn-glycerol-3-phosphate acyltransferase [Lachnospiraceae bacterium]|nr:1-acyl-sn-glycerol-3-phosphate acyltransferase [Lachnospiraceae bacterium]
MKRIILMVMRLFFMAPVWFFKIWSWGRDDRHAEKEKFELLRHVTTRANRAGRVTIEPHGLENLPEEPGYIMFPNHQGLFDVLGFLETSPQPFTVVMKKEVENVFLLKQVRILLKAQCMDREDIRDSLRVINQMTKEVKEGRNYLIFPEGTRSKNGNCLLEFKGGSFKSAVNARCPIVPVAVIDSYQAFDTNSIRPVTVKLHYLPPILCEEYQGMRTNDIAALVKARIEETIAQYT